MPYGAKSRLARRLRDSEMMLPTHDVDCPACGKFVYTALSLEDVMAADAPTSPKVETDARGDYITCPHCRARIPMKRITTDAGPGFRVADEASK
jgi:DNA-directed RNA polymerase subunit RPC12/RpoP